MFRSNIEVETDKFEEASIEEFQEVVATRPLHVRREAIEAFFPRRCLIRDLMRDVE